ncbi:MAG TPA: GYD domain-containing protein [Terriglobia bacterium]|nr:GYD domain-containing protein [Terriglobia bacterium]
MAKYLIQATYSAEGFKGVAKDKASGRKAALEKALAGVGAGLDAIYYSFGDYDVVLIVDAPDNATVAAVGMAACSTGLARTSTTPLLTIEEADQAVKKSVRYRGPGQ